jgi:hypothetical protein
MSTISVSNFLTTLMDKFKNCLSLHIQTFYEDIHVFQSGSESYIQDSAAYFLVGSNIEATNGNADPSTSQTIVFWCSICPETRGYRVY